MSKVQWFTFKAILFYSTICTIDFFLNNIILFKGMFNTNIKKKNIPFGLISTDVNFVLLDFEFRTVAYIS